LKKKVSQMIGGTLRKKTRKKLKGPRRKDGKNWPKRGANKRSLGLVKIEGQVKEKLKAEKPEREESEELLRDLEN